MKKLLSAQSKRTFAWQKSLAYAGRPAVHFFALITKTLPRAIDNMQVKKQAFRIKCVPRGGIQR